MRNVRSSGRHRLGRFVAAPGAQTAWLSDDADALADLGDDLDGMFHLGWLMRCSDGGAQTRQAFGHGRRDHRQHEDIPVLGLPRHRIGALIRTAQHRHDGGRGEQRVEAGGLEAADEQGACSG